MYKKQSTSIALQLQIIIIVSFSEVFHTLQPAVKVPTAGESVARVAVVSTTSVREIDRGRRRCSTMPVGGD